MGSLGQGDVSAIAADGTVTQLHQGDGDPDRVTLGMKVDSPRDRLVVCTYRAPEDDAPPTGRVWLFDLESGDRTHDVDLIEAADHGSCNDIVVDERGVIYVTDRELPNVYRLEAAKGGGHTLTLFATDPLLAKPRLGIGQNGIAITPDGKSLLTTRYLPPRLHRIDLADPTDVSKVELDGRHPLSELLAGADGMVFEGDELFVAFGGSVLRVRTDDPSWRIGRFDRLDVGVKIAALTFADGLMYVLKSDVAKFVLGGEPDLPFELIAVDPTRFD